MTGTARTAVSIVAAELREQILDAVLAPGSALREEALSERFGVNRHTVRAALQQLAAQRLVDFAPYRGARVRAFSDDDIRSLMEYRTALEAEAVRLLQARTATPGAVVEIPDAVVEANGELRALCALHPDDHRAIERAHARLHHALVASAGSPRLTEAHAGLESELLLFLNQLRPLLPAAEMAEQHDRLLQAIRTRGDAAIREHLAHSAAQLIALHAAAPGP
ncbi:GntR family transcriptional regulator [Herbiconiux sp. YIM B11900]|uniref:GntR family transcriptional regulator n=1 Tax=Herbiconiux sp. YIM B11900 TaxID=3404131 RepID=UPI003F832CBA